MKLAKISVLLLITLILAGCLDSSGSKAGSTSDSSGSKAGSTSDSESSTQDSEAPSNVNVLTSFAGTYNVSGTATDHTADRGTATRNHARGTITIHSNGTVDYDTSISFTADQINAIYDRRNICDFPPEANRDACRVHVNYDADDTGRKLEIFLALDKTSVKEIRYQNGQGEITRALIGSGTGEGDGNDVTTEPTGALNNSLLLKNLTGLDEIGKITIRDAQRVGNKVLIFADSNNISGNYNRVVFRLAEDGRSLDTSFAEKGVLHQTGTTANEMTAVAHALDNHERIYLLNNQLGYTLTRYTSDGLVDPTYGSSGVLKPNVWGTSGNNPVPAAIAVMQDGSLIWAGRKTTSLNKYRWVLGRIDKDGQVSDTPVELNLIDDDRGNSIQKLLVDEANDHLYIAGSLGTQNSRDNVDRVLVRLMLDSEDNSKDLQVDANYGTNGKVTVLTQTSIAEGYHTAIQGILLDNNGNLLVAGHSISDESKKSADFTILRLTSHGALDTAFGAKGTGIVKVNFNSSRNANYQDFATQIQLTSSGKIFVAGHSKPPGSGAAGEHPRLSMIRLLANGQLDTTFGFYDKLGSINTNTYGQNISITEENNWTITPQTAVVQDKDGRLMGISTQCEKIGTDTFCSGSYQDPDYPVMIQWWD